MRTNGLGLARARTGVVSQSAVGLATGNSVYAISYTRGTVVMTFSQVATSGYTSVNVTMRLYVRSTSWSSSDRLQITVARSSGATLTLLNVDGSQFSSGGYLNTWRTIGLSGATGAGTVSWVQVVVKLTSSTNLETVLIDDVTVTGIKSSLAAYTTFVCLCPPAFTGATCGTQLY